MSPISTARASPASETPAGAPGVYGRGNNFGVFGSSSTASTTTAAVWGENTVAGGTGVVGKALAANGGGVSGIGDMAGSTGVYGRGANLGVFGTTTNGTGVSGNSTGGRGVYGISATASTTLAGVWGENSASGGTGVVGKALGVNGGGVSGIGDTSGSTGVYGRGAGLGVFGTSTNGTGVFGTTNATSTSKAGVWGETTASGGNGVVGNAANTSGAGVAGIGDTAGSIGVYARGNASGVSAHSTAGIGLFAKSTSSIGVHGRSGTTYGVVGESTSGDGVYGQSETGNGIYGRTNSPTKAGVWADNYLPGGNAIVGITHVGASGSGGNSAGIWGLANVAGGWAGEFHGSVQVPGDFSAFSKSFKIDHPLDPANKYLLHGCIESPDVKKPYDGNVITDGNGEATITLPSYFEALNRDFRYQLTVLGQFAQAIVASEIADNQFTIKTGKPNVKVSWQVTGIRHDAYMVAHPMVVEQDKTKEERGTYQMPELFGQPEEKSLSWKQNPELWKRLKAERLKRESEAKAKAK